MPKQHPGGNLNPSSHRRAVFGGELPDWLAFDESYLQLAVVSHPQELS